MEVLLMAVRDFCDLLSLSMGIEAEEVELKTIHSLSRYQCYAT
jgi:hypothetical protein